MAQKQIEERMEGTEKDISEMKKAIQGMGKNLERLALNMSENQKALVWMMVEIAAGRRQSSMTTSNQ